MEIFNYGKDYLTAGKALRILSGGLQGVLDPETANRIIKSQRIVEEIAANEQVVYGINSGFGPLCTTKISTENTKLLQENILMSHSVGIGELIPHEIARLMLVLKINALSQGYSGISINTLERIKWFVDNNITPEVPSQGSVGASGDLAPLSHLFLPLIGYGRVLYKGKSVSTSEMMQKEGIQKIILGPKEGLALINGTQFIASYAIKVLEKMHSCLSQADLISAMMLEGLLGSSQPFYHQLHALRPFKGTQHVAERMLSTIRSSAILASHKNCERVQDPYSLRCIPQVHGASRNAWLHLKDLLEIELNAVTDNPVIINNELAISGGNFHGQPLALPLDYACIASSEMGNISDRRIYLSLLGDTSDLPKLLVKETGLHSGFMILQYTSAALASENKTLCYPASADSIPTSLGQEDHVSMGSIAGRKALTVLDNVEKILAIELICACQALDFRRPLKSTPLIEAIHEEIRAIIPHAKNDRVYGEDIKLAHSFIQKKTILSLTNSLTNSKKINIITEYDHLFEIY